MKSPSIQIADYFKDYKEIIAVYLYNIVCHDVILRGFAAINSIKKCLFTQ